MKIFLSIVLLLIFTIAGYAVGLYHGFEENFESKYWAIHANTMADNAQLNIKRNNQLAEYVQNQELETLIKFLKIDNESNEEIIQWSRELCNEKDCSDNIRSILEGQLEPPRRNITSQVSNAPTAQDKH